MIGAIAGLYALILTEYEKKWKKEQEVQDWNRWEHLEEMREEMGHTTGIIKIPKRKGRPPRKKHGH